MFHANGIAAGWRVTVAVPGRTKSCPPQCPSSNASTAVVPVTRDQATILISLFPQVTAVETRGIEPLTPALQSPTTPPTRAATSITSSAPGPSRTRERTGGRGFVSRAVSRQPRVTSARQRPGPDAKLGQDVLHVSGHRPRRDDQCGLGHARGPSPRTPARGSAAPGGSARAGFRRRQHHHRHQAVRTLRGADQHGDPHVPNRLLEALMTFPSPSCRPMRSLGAVTDCGQRSPVAALIARNPVTARCQQGSQPGGQADKARGQCREGSTSRPPGPLP
jgi:hypothetical protein